MRPSDTRYAELAPQLMDGRLAITVGCDSPTIRPLCLDPLPPAWDEANVAARMVLPTAAALTLWRTIDYCWLDPTWAGLPAPEARHESIVWQSGPHHVELRLTDWRFAYHGVDVFGFQHAELGIRGADVTDQMHLYGARFADLVWRFANGQPLSWSGFVPRGWQAPRAPTVILEARDVGWTAVRWLFGVGGQFIPEYGKAELGDRPLWAVPVRGETFDAMLDDLHATRLPGSWTGAKARAAIKHGVRVRWRKALAAADPAFRHAPSLPIVVNVGVHGRPLGARYAASTSPSGIAPTAGSADTAGPMPAPVREAPTTSPIPPERGTPSPGNVVALRDRARPNMPRRAGR